MKRRKSHTLNNTPACHLRIGQSYSHANTVFEGQRLQECDQLHEPSKQDHGFSEI
jgi:hypothetical protein